MTAKEQFLRTEHAKPHAEAVHSDQFQAALNFSMLALLESDLQISPDYIAGAKALRSKLESIGTREPAPPPSLETKLRHDAYDARRR